MILSPLKFTRKIPDSPISDAELPLVFVGTATCVPGSTALHLSATIYSTKIIRVTFEVLELTTSLRQ